MLPHKQLYIFYLESKMNFMRFVVKYKEFNHENSLLYLSNEMSFYVDHGEKNVYSLMLGSGYASLDVEIESGRALAITGYNPSFLWVKCELEAPIYNTGELFIVSKEELMSGAGSYYAKDWQTFYDPKSGWICIGNKNINAHGDCVEFFKNIVAVVHDNQLLSVWLKPIIK